MRIYTQRPDHNTGNYVPYSLRTVSGFFLTSHRVIYEQELWDGAYGLLSLSQKTRKSNHLQMSSQRQHFFLSYLKTLSGGPAGVWTRDLPSIQSRLQSVQGVRSFYVEHNKEELEKVIAIVKKEVEI